MCFKYMDLTEIKDMVYHVCMTIDVRYKCICVYWQFLW